MVPGSGFMATDAHSMDLVIHSPNPTPWYRVSEWGSEMWAMAGTYPWHGGRCMGMGADSKIRKVGGYGVD